MKCYNVKVEGDDNDPHDINIPKSEGSQEVCGPKIEDPVVAAPLKMKQVNIRTEEELKYATFGDYWDNAIVEKVIELLQ